MKLDDEVRLNILDALLKPGSVSPNIKQIQKSTNYHKATIKSSLDFFTKESLIAGYGPKVDFRGFGYKLEVLSLIQADLTKKDLFERYLNEVKKDSNLYSLTSLAGSGKYNLVARHIYKDVETFHEAVNKKYFEQLDGIYDFIKSREIVYVTEPYFKMDSRTASLIKIIRKSRGYD